MTDLTRVTAWLAQIPALAAQIDPGGTPSRGEGSEAARSTPAASRPPLDLHALELRDGRHLWNWAHLIIDERADLDEDLADAPGKHATITNLTDWLTRHIVWIVAQHPHFEEDIRRLYWTYRFAAGDRPGPKLDCTKCGNRAHIDGQWLICTEVEEHARTVKDIEHEHRYQPALPTDQVATQYNLKPGTLRVWRKRNKIRPARKEGRVTYWWPWDVFRALHPTVAEAIDARDEVSAGGIRQLSS